MHGPRAAGAPPRLGRAPDQNGVPYDVRVEGRDIEALALLNEPLRRRLYDLAVGAGELSREGAVEILGISSSVVAFHLDKLVEAGLLEVSYRRPPGRVGPGAGRPAKWYRRAQGELSVSVPSRHYELAARLLAAAVERAEARSQPVSKALRYVAREHGRRLGASLEGPGELMSLLSEQGYEPRREEATIVLGNCPFRALAADHRELVCSMNHDILDGLAAALGLPARTVRPDPRPRCCCVSLAC